MSDAEYRARMDTRSHYETQMLGSLKDIRDAIEDRRETPRAPIARQPRRPTSGGVPLN